MLERGAIAIDALCIVMKMKAVIFCAMNRQTNCWNGQIFIIGEDVQKYGRLLIQMGKEGWLFHLARDVKFLIRRLRKRLNNMGGDL